MRFLQNWKLSFVLFALVLAVVVACKNDDTPEPVPTVTGLNPTSAPVGTDIKITGTEFGTNAADVKVTFTGGVVGTVKAVTPTEITVTVPSGAQNGTVTVQIGTKTPVTGTTAFTLGPKTVQEVTGNLTASATWTADKVYLLKGFVYVKDGVTLTIQPGTIIKGGTKDVDPTASGKGGSLIVQPGGKLIAEGTVDKPIIFTSSKPAGQRNYGDWGGIVLIGKAPINQPSAKFFEGGIEGSVGSFNVPTDNSGSLKYVRIEFAGIALSAQANSEINGLTMYGVGSGTTIDYVQVSYSGDDSYEWFGGNVNAKHLVAFRGFDDDWDTDWGWSGKVQFGVSLRDPNVADQSTSNGFESDNFEPGTPANGSNDGLPLTEGTFANISNFVFQAAPSTATTSNGSGSFGRSMHLRRNTAISIFNTVLVGYPEGLRLDGKKLATLKNVQDGKLQLRGIVLANMATPFKGADEIVDADASTFFNTVDSKNTVVALADLATLKLNAKSFDLAAPAFTVGSDSPLLTGAVWTGKGADSFFQQVAYRGAFNATDNWLDKWTNFTPQNTDYDK